MKHLFALLLCLISLSARADWALISEAENGDRLLGQAGSLSVDRNSKDIWVASAVFAMTKDGQLGLPFIAVVAVESCARSGGEIIIGRDEKNLRRYWWAASGTKMYDAMAQAICIALASKFKNQKQDQETKQL